MILEVVGILPGVAGMRLLDVNGEKRGIGFVLVVQGAQGGNLPPEGGSRVAPKYQDDRFLPLER